MKGCAVRLVKCTVVEEVNSSGEVRSRCTSYAVTARSAARVRDSVRVSEGMALNLPAQRFAAWPPSRRSEEHTSELQSLMRISYAVFCLKKKKKKYKSITKKQKTE